jgi:hypothetical protein
MSAWTLWTWISIGVLAGGAPAIFVWFCRDAGRLFRQTGGELGHRGVAAAGRPRRGPDPRDD